MPQCGIQLGLCMDLEQKRQLDATRWVNNYSDSLFTYALRRVKDTHTAKDLVQDTFLAAWRNAENYNGTAPVLSWLYAILKNKIIDHYRNTANRLTDELASENYEGDHYFGANGQWLSSVSFANWSSSPVNPLDSKEFIKIFNNCKKKLKDLQGAVFTMKYIDGMGSDKICIELNISSSNYWVLIHRSKLQLKACLEKTWGFN